MVALPLFKLGALFVRHISKYGANRIKQQAHDHPNFRSFAARYGQTIHQLNMRLSVALLRNPAAEKKAKELAEAPTVKTEEQVKKQEDVKTKYGISKDASQSDHQPTGLWKRKFRSLPEAKAVDLFADVVGDAFILLIASVLVIYETQWKSAKPDATLDKIKELDDRLEALRQKEDELEAQGMEQQARVQMIEDALRSFNDSQTKRPVLLTPA